MRRPRQRLTGCSLVAVLTLALLACKERRRDSASAVAEVPRPAQPTGTPAPLEPRPEAPLAATALDSAAVDSGAADSGAPDTPAPRMAPPAPPNPNHDGCRSSGQACTCSNTGWSGKCATGGAKSGLYCHCD